MICCFRFFVYITFAFSVLAVPPLIFPDGMDALGQSRTTKMQSGLADRVVSTEVGIKLPLCDDKVAPADEMCEAVDCLYRKGRAILRETYLLPSDSQKVRECILQGLSLLIQAGNYRHPLAIRKLHEIFEKGLYGITKQATRAHLYDIPLHDGWAQAYASLFEKQRVSRQQQISVHNADFVANRRHQRLVEAENAHHSMAGHGPKSFIAGLLGVGLFH